MKNLEWKEIHWKIVSAFECVPPPVLGVDMSTPSITGVSITPAVPEMVETYHGIQSELVETINNFPLDIRTALT